MPPLVVSPVLDRRCVIVGDVHGCLMELKRLLNKCGYQRGIDRLIFVGDLVGKGPNGPGVVRLVRSLKAECVRGNWEQHILRKHSRLSTTQSEDRSSGATSEPQGSTSEPEKALDLDKSTSKPAPRSKTGRRVTSPTEKNRFTKSQIEWMAQLPFFIHLLTWNTVVVHAGLVPDVPLHAQNPSDLIHMRFLEWKKDAGWCTHSRLPQEGLTDKSDTATKSKPNNGAESAGPLLWITQWHGPYFVVFGHDAERGLQQSEWAMGLDTGCVYGKKLTALVLPGRHVVQVSALRRYCSDTRQRRVGFGFSPICNGWRKKMSVVYHRVFELFSRWKKWISGCVSRPSKESLGNPDAVKVKVNK